MKTAARNSLLLVCAVAAGLGASEILYRATWSRDAIGVVAGRGKFLALVRGRALHERDLQRETDASAETMVAAEALRRAAGGERMTNDEVERAFDLLRWQFGDENKFAAALVSSHLTAPWLRALLADHLAVRRELETRVASTVGVTEEECRRIYESEPEKFVLPPRFRARHIFVAAPEGTDPEMMLAQRGLAQGLSIRLLAGEEFAELAAEASEDEATKLNGGDLNYFSAERVSPEFVLELKKLTVGQTSPPVPSRLGFHIIELTETLPERALTFEEARGEIATGMANQRRAAEIAVLRERARRMPRLVAGAVAR